jgi:hypothetical protein
MSYAAWALVSSCTNPEGWSIDTGAGASDVVSILFDSVAAAKLIRPWVAAPSCGFHADIPGGTWEGSNGLKKQAQRKSIVTSERVWKKYWDLLDVHAICEGSVTA